MASVSAEGERTFVRLWTHCDDQGRCLNNPKLIRAALYPLHDSMTAGTLEGDLDELEDAGLILRYEVDGRSYLSIRSWDEYQHPQRPRASKYPPPPEASASPHAHVADTAGTGEGGERETGEGGEDARRSLSLAENFNAWYSEYPLKKGRRAAETAYRSALKRGALPEEILDGLRRTLPNFANAEPRFIPYPTTWLNRDGWLDVCDADAAADARAQMLARIDARNSA